MYLYNTTFCLEDSVLEQWKEWLDEEYIPMMTATGEFSDVRIYRVLTENAGDSISISIQFSVEALVSVQRWKGVGEAALASALAKVFGTKVLSFSTVLEVLV